MENSDYFEKCRKYWANAIVQGALKYPEPQVIRFVKRNFKSPVTILDFGCGAGRDSLALANEGYNVIAMDYNQSGLDILHSQNNSINTICSHDIEVPLPEESVDAIICDGSLFYNDLENTVVLLSNLRKVLKKNGLIWADWRTKNDSLYGKGELIGEDYYLLKDRANATYLFMSEENLRKVYSAAGFIIESIDIGGFSVNNRETVNEWFYVVAKK